MKITDLKIITSVDGSVMHAIKSIDDGFNQFGEVYFSTVNNNSIKAWKLHKEMTLNLVVPTGKVLFNFYDQRKDSKTFHKYDVLEISSEGRESIYVPAGCANAFLTMSDNTILHYYMGDFFNQNTYKGIRYNDPAFGVEWPCEPQIISERDLNFPNFK